MTIAVRHDDRGAAASQGRDDSRLVLGVAASASGRRWCARLDPAGEAAALAIAQRHGLDELVSRVLAGRRVAPDAAGRFVEPSLRDLLPDPSRLVDMDAAAARLADAVARCEQVALFGDYDVDGATSVALLGRVLGACGLAPAIHIPDRLVDGYGPTPAAVRRIAEAGARLLVTLDCGSSSHAALEEARRLGLEVVVIDHHPAAERLPPAVALVNPNRPDDLAGQGHLAAVGVTFLVAVALVRELRRRGVTVDLDLLGLLDLVALGTVADMVPLVGVNRAFVTKGLIACRAGRRPGLVALGAAAGLEGPIGVTHLGFLLGPRINAGGRIGDSGLGARLLMTEDADEAGRIAAALDRLNRERQVIEGAAVAEAIGQAGEVGSRAVVLVAGDWHPGVVGLVAARLKERLRRPAIAVAFQGADGERANRGSGSGRSIPGVDLGGAITAAVEAGLLVKGGGHPMAAGLTVERERLADLARFLEDWLAPSVARSAADHDLAIDGVLTASAATPGLVAALERAGPFGSGNPEPVVALPGHRVAWAEATAQGHVRASLAGSDGTSLRAIAFRAADQPAGRALLAARGQALHVAGCLAADHRRGVARPQLRILDVAGGAATALPGLSGAPYHLGR